MTTSQPQTVPESDNSDTRNEERIVGDTQPQTELGEILNRYAKAYYEAKYESRLNTCEWAANEAKQAILDWHYKQVEKAVREARIDELRRHTKKRKHWKEEGKELEIRGWNGHINELEKRIAKLTSKESE